jgi:acyl-CoA dehydrogenase
VFGLDLAPEIDDLRVAAERLCREELAPNVREAEAAGLWPERVLDVLARFPLSGLDLPESLGGSGGGCVAKVVLLETLARADASGLPAADPLGLSSGALMSCPDAALVAAVVGTCRDGSAQCAFTVSDPEAPCEMVAWAPGWPPLRWAWVCEGDTLRLHEVGDQARPVSALAFQASGAVEVPLGHATLRGRWELPASTGVAVRGRARLWTAAVAIGIAGAALQETIEYTIERVVFGKPVAHHQGNAFDLAFVASRVHGARLVVRDAAHAFDRDDVDAGFWATQAWLETVDAAFVATDTGIQLLGGHGFIADHLAEKRFREARMLALMVGGRDAAEFDAAASVVDAADLLAARPAQS